MRSAAVFITGELVNCTAPPHAAGVVAVEVATNGVDFSASNASYVYIAAVRVLALLPSAGPTGGSTNVSVIGSSLLRGSSCRFGGLAAVSSHWVSSNELVCESPAQTAGSHAVEVSSNAQDWSGSGVRFAYQQPLRVHIHCHVLHSWWESVRSGDIVFIETMTVTTRSRLRFDM